MNETTIRNLQTAEHITDTLTSLGITPPAELTDALDVLAAVRNTRTTTTIDLETEAATVTADKVAKLIDRAVEDRARRDARRQVTADVEESAARRVHGALSRTAPAIVDQLADTFTAAAERFTAAVRHLPTDYTDADRLVRAGADTVGYFTAATEEAATLEALRSIRDRLANLGARARGEVTVERGTRYATVRNTGTGRRASAALNDRSNPLGAFGSLLATEGVTGLHWPTIDEHTAYIASLPAQEDHYERVNLGAGVTGQRRVTA